MSQLTDGSGRKINYLRISVTDKCNFRCLYCMPEEGLQWLPKSEILSYEEIAEVVRQLLPLGVTRLRITGGEPLIRPDLERLIAQLKALDGIEDIALSTNGVHLPKLARALREAGLDRVNLSADSLRAERIAKIARRSLGFEPVASALAAEEAGLSPVKINVVVMRGINDDEIEDFARLTLDHPWHVRFIELMPVGGMRDVTFEHIVPSDEILDRLSSIAPLTAVDGPERETGRRNISPSPERPAAWGHHADDAHLLLDVQQSPPHRRRETAHVPVRRPRAGSADADQERTADRADCRGGAAREAAGACAAANESWGAERAVAGRRVAASAPPE